MEALSRQPIAFPYNDEGPLVSRRRALVIGFRRNSALPYPAARDEHDHRGTNWGYSPFGSLKRAKRGVSPIGSSRRFMLTDG